ncbi:MAG TPA: FtsQ-type POTRA domain-containing protein [Nitrospiraceae bacterium]
MLRSVTTAGFGRTKRPRQNLQRSPARTSGRREHGGRVRRILRAMLWITAASLGAWTAILAYETTGPLLAASFEIREVRVTGLRTVTRDEVLDRLQLETRATLLSVSPAQLETRVSAHPWVRSAVVSRSPFHALSVEVAERRPAAVLRTTSSAFLLDDEGAVLTVLAEREHEELPVVVGLDHKRLIQGDARLRHAAENGIKLAGLLAQSLDGRAEIDLSDPEHAVAYVRGMRFQFGPAPLEEQWERYRAVEPVRRAGDGKGRSDIDLRFSDKVIVREREQLS